MARQLNAYLHPDQVPDHATLQAAVKGLGFGIVFDAPWVPFETTGYFPCTAQGEDAGMDLRFQADGPWPETAAANAAAQGARSVLVRLRWSGDKREELCATALAAALVGSCDAVVLEPERGVRKSLSGLKAHARELHEGTF